MRTTLKQFYPAPAFPSGPAIGQILLAPVAVDRRLRLSSGRNNRNQSGFTLLELLVVLTIMGLFAGLASAIVRTDDRDLLQVEAERLARLLDLAMLEARFSGNAIAWSSDGSGYQFWQQDPQRQWQPLAGNELLRDRSLPTGMRIRTLAIENVPSENWRLVFVSHAQALIFSIEMQLGTETLHVTGSPIGEVRVVSNADAISAGME